jgi:hypothetical protein
MLDEFIRFIDNLVSNLYQYIPILFFLLFLVLIIFSVFGKIRFNDYNSHWNTLIDTFKFSTKEFYSLLVSELKAHGIQNMKFHEVKLREGGWFTPKRIYLRVQWKNVEYYICASPFAHGFYVSWWLFERKTFMRRLISKIWFIGSFLERKFFPTTFHTIDTSSMFMTYAQDSVLKIIDEITKEQGIKGLSELERKPILQDLFKR